MSKKGVILKSFNFTLDKVLGYREQVLDLEKNSLAIEVAKENTLLSAIEKTQRNIDEQSEHLKKLMSEGTSIINVRQHSNQIDGLKKTLKQQKFQLVEQQKLVEKQRGIVVKANQDFTILEKLKDRKYSEHLYESLKEENSRIEEIVITNLSRQSNSSPSPR